MRFLFLPLALFVCSVFNLSGMAFAYERISNPYQASVLLDDRGAQSRDRAISRGLEQVLVRYTGYSGVTGFAGVEEVLRDAQRYVIEYGVETVVVPADDQIGVKQTDALWVRYNAGLVEQLVEDLELPIWPALRPTLSYLVISELWGEPYLPGSADFPALDTHLKKLFSFRGLAANSLDASKVWGISADRLWHLDEAILQKLKSQAGTDVVALVRAKTAYDGSYDLDFVIAGEGSEMLLNRNSETLFSALDSGFNFYIDTLSAELSFLGGTNIEQDLYIEVAGMRSYPEYKRVLNQIAGLEQVLSVRMDNAKDESVGYLIRYQSNLELLLEAIVAITRLKPLNLPSVPTGQQSEELTVAPQLGTNNQPLLFIFPDMTFMDEYDVLERYSSPDNGGNLQQKIPDSVRLDDLNNVTSDHQSFPDPIDALASPGDSVKTGRSE